METTISDITFEFGATLSAQFAAQDFISCARKPARNIMDFEVNPASRFTQRNLSDQVESLAVNAIGSASNTSAQ